jgi:hypothetical protein
MASIGCRRDSTSAVFRDREHQFLFEPCLRIRGRGLTLLNTGLRTVYRPGDRSITSTRLPAWLVPIFPVVLALSSAFKTAPQFSISGANVASTSGLVSTDLTALLLVATAAIVCHRIVYRGSVPRSIIRPVMGFLLLVPPIAVAPHTGYAFLKIAELFTISFLVCIAPVILIESAADLRRWITMLSVFCAFHVVGSLVSPHFAYSGAPISSFAGTTIILGMTSATLLVVTCLSVMWLKLHWSLGLPLVALAAVSLLASGSRGPLIAAVTAFLVAVLAVPGRRRLTGAIWIVAAAGVALFYGFQSAPIYAQARIASLLAGQLDPSRETLYAIAWSSIHAHPMGLGWGGFASLTGIASPHNLVLELLCEGGLLFGSMFIMWLCVVVIRTRRAAVNYLAVTAFAILVLNVSEAVIGGTDLRDGRYLFLAVGIAIATAAIVRKGSSEHAAVGWRPGNLIGTQSIEPNRFPPIQESDVHRVANHLGG